jgi:hypothetical protein
MAETTWYRMKDGSGRLYALAEKDGRHTLYFPDVDGHELYAPNGGVRRDPSHIPVRLWRDDVTDPARFKIKRHELVLHPQVPAVTPPGVYVPRVYRGPEHPPADVGALGASVVVARGLLTRMRAIFHVVEPARVQAGVFGHELRQLLILACNEVESAWQAVLEHNEYSSKSRWTTDDYVQLLEPLKLAEYTLELTLYPSYGDVRPFLAWTRIGGATKSLPWYAAYNLTKHNRERALCVASLDHVISAIAAAVIMIEAQFGPEPSGSELLPDDFTVQRRPTWVEDATIRPLLEPDEPEMAEWPHEWRAQTLFGGTKR